MMRIARLTILATLALTLAACSAPAPAPATSLPDVLRERAARVTIVRDDWGIPHIHGTSDAQIPVEQGRKLFAAAKEPKKWMEIAGGKHWVAEVGGPKYMNAVVEFISANTENKIAAK